MSQSSFESGPPPGGPSGEHGRRPLGGARRFLADNRRSAGLLLGLILVAFAVAGALGLREWRQAEEEGAEARVFGSAGVAADQIEGILAGASPALAAALAGAIEDGEPDLRSGLGVDGEAWALDRDGSVIASTGAPRPGFPPEARAAVAGTVAVSGLTRPGAGRELQLAVPAAGDARAAAFLAAVPPRVVAAYVTPAISPAPFGSSARAVVVAEDGDALTSTGLDRAEGAAIAARGTGSGRAEIDGETELYSAAPIGDSTWTVVLAAPEDDVLAAAGGPAGWMGWAVLAEVVLAGLLGFLLLARLVGDAARVDRANVELSRRSATAESATEAKSGFISTMAHEMRTPLAAISMFAEMMRTDALEPLPPNQRRRATDIASSTRHLLDLLDEASDLSRIESGRLELHPERVSVPAIAIAVVDAMYPLAVERGIDLSLEADGKLGEVFVDPGRVRQVMINFLSNALKFTPGGGRVRLRAERHGGADFEIAVDDTGIGIEPERVGDVFDPGRRPSAPVHPQDDTSGLGLALTKRLIEAMGGSVGVRSDLGAGSTFSAVLPLVSAERRARLDAAPAEQHSG